MKNPVWVLAALLLLWGAVLVQAERSVFAAVPQLDEVWYLDRAAELDGLAAPADRAHFMSPLYPVLLKLAGAGGGLPADRVAPPGMLRGARALQILCWLGVVWLLHRSAARVLPPEGPGRRLLRWLPALLFVLYRPGAVYALAILVELPLLLLVTLVLALLLAPGTSWRKALAVGVALGLAGLMRGTALALVPVALAVFLADRRPAGVRGALLVALAVVAVMLPAMVHNGRVEGRAVGPTLNAGVNLMVGNGPEANGFYVAVVPGDWRTDPAGRTHLADETGLPAVSLAQADSIWASRARGAAAARPGFTLALWLKKVWLHLQSWEIDQLTPLAGWRDTVPLLGLWVVPWSLLVVPALVGAVDLFRRRPPRWWILPAAGGALLGLQSVFFVVSRYRLTLVPVLALLAGVGAAALWRRDRVSWIVLPVAVLLVVPWGLAPVQAQWRAQALTNEAVRRADLGRAAHDPAETARAVALYRQSLDEGADGAAPWLGLAAVLDDQGDAAGALEVLADAVDHRPGDRGLRAVLVGRQLSLGRDLAALETLQDQLVRWPDDADALHNMTILLARLGRTQEALERARSLVAAAPDDPRGYNDLGILLARQGDPEGAAAVFRRGLAAVPDDPDLAANLRRVDPAAADSVE